MAFIIDTPIVKTLTATTFFVTQIDNNIENQYINIHYVLMLDDGTPYQRGICTVARGYDEAKALYAEMDAKIATGMSFEDASTAVCEERVKAHLAV